MAWVLEFLGVVIGPAVIPLAGSLMSDSMTKETAIYSPLFSLAVALAAWLGVTKQQYGFISVDTTFGMALTDPRADECMIDASLLKAIGQCSPDPWLASLHLSSGIGRHASYSVRHRSTIGVGS